MAATLGKEIYTLFYDCVVRVRSGSGQGTGFFVSPGRIMTCAHVIGCANPDQVQTYWRQKELIPTRVDSQWQESGNEGNLDIAVLHVAITEHPCVELDVDVLPRDRLHSFGYPENKHGGQPLGPECVGLTEEEKFLVLKDENIRPGFSGAPLLNERTLKVCGAIKSNRSIQVVNNIFRGFGGYAIPIHRILYQFPRVREDNDVFHAQDKKWHSAMNPMSRNNETKASAEKESLTSRVKRRAMQERLVRLEKEYTACNQQIGRCFNDVEKMRLEYQASQILQEIRDIEDSLS
ncbi:trypsin-like peptidase domain-containing protein [Rubidibacter lacunae]|uniref:trypsin-like peptidase domain-containing protein n=1 Tax=Rubidibacter lacunae TaxID=582514 RepID=UPI0008FEF58D|nr:trypsin-like peptidase domain-containing protein [Rubidibacter lacunae]